MKINYFIKSKSQNNILLKFIETMDQSAKAAVAQSDQRQVSPSHESEHPLGQAAVKEAAVASDIMNSKSGSLSDQAEEERSMADSSAIMKKAESVYKKNIYIKEDPEGINISKSDMMTQSVNKAKLKSILPDILKLEINPKPKLEQKVPNNEDLEEIATGQEIKPQPKEVVRQKSRMQKWMSNELFYKDGQSGRNAPSGESATRGPSGPVPLEDGSGRLLSSNPINQSSDQNFKEETPELPTETVSPLVVRKVTPNMAEIHEIQSSARQSIDEDLQNALRFKQIKTELQTVPQTGVMQIDSSYEEQGNTQERAHNTTNNSINLTGTGSFSKKGTVMMKTPKGGGKMTPSGPVSPGFKDDDVSNVPSQYNNTSPIRHMQNFEVNIRRIDENGQVINQNYKMGENQNQLISEMQIIDGQGMPSVQAMTPEQIYQRSPRKEKFDPTQVIRGVQGAGVQIYQPQFRAPPIQYDRKAKKSTKQQGKAKVLKGKRDVKKESLRYSKLKHDMDADLDESVHLGKPGSAIKIQGFDQFSNVTSSIVAEHSKQEAGGSTPLKQTPKNTDIFSGPEIQHMTRISPSATQQTDLTFRNNNQTKQSCIISNQQNDEDAELDQEPESMYPQIPQYSTNNIKVQEHLLNEQSFTDQMHSTGEFNPSPEQQSLMENSHENHQEFDYKSYGERPSIFSREQAAHRKREEEELKNNALYELQDQGYEIDDRRFKILYNPKMSKVSESKRLQYLHHQAQLRKHQQQLKNVKDPDVISHSMRQFKESIINQQIKTDIDPARWIPNGKIVHDQVTQKKEKNGMRHIAPPSFKLSVHKKLVAKDFQQKEEKQHSPSFEVQESHQTITTNEHIQLIVDNKTSNSILQNQLSVQKLRKMKQEAKLTQKLISGAITCQKAVINRINLHGEESLPLHLTNQTSHQGYESSDTMVQQKPQKQRQIRFMKASPNKLHSDVSSQQSLEKEKALALDTSNNEQVRTALVNQNLNGVNWHSTKTSNTNTNLASKEGDRAVTTMLASKGDVNRDYIDDVNPLSGKGKNYQTLVINKPSELDCLGKVVQMSKEAGFDVSESKTNVGDQKCDDAGSEKRLANKELKLTLKPIIQPILGSKGSKLEGQVINQENRLLQLSKRSENSLKSKRNSDRRNSTLGSQEDKSSRRGSQVRNKEPFKVSKHVDTRPSPASHKAKKKSKANDDIQQLLQSRESNPSNSRTQKSFYNTVAQATQHLSHVNSSGQSPGKLQSEWQQSEDTLEHQQQNNQFNKFDPKYKLVKNSETADTLGIDLKSQPVSQMPSNFELAPDLAKTQWPSGKPKLPKTAQAVAVPRPALSLSPPLNPTSAQNQQNKAYNLLQQQYVSYKDQSRKLRMNLLHQTSGPFETSSRRLPTRFMSLENQSSTNARPALKHRVLNIRGSNDGKSRNNSKEHQQQWNEYDESQQMDQSIHTPLDRNPAFNGTVRLPNAMQTGFTTNHHGKFGSKKNTQIFTNTTHIEKFKRGDFEARSMNKKTPFTPFTPNQPMEGQQPLFDLRSGQGDLSLEAVPIDHANHFQQIYNLETARPKFELSEMVTTPLAGAQRMQITANNFNTFEPTGATAENVSFAGGRSVLDMNMTGDFSTATPQQPKFGQTGRHAEAGRHQRVHSMNNSAYTVRLAPSPEGQQQQPRISPLEQQPRSPTAEAMSVDVVQPQLLPHLIQHSVGSHNLLTYSNVNKLLNKAQPHKAQPAAPASKRGSLPLNKIQRLQELKEQLQYHRLIKQNIRNKNLDLPRQTWKKKNPLKYNDEVIGEATRGEIHDLHQNVRKVSIDMLNRTMETQYTQRNNQLHALF